LTESQASHQTRNLLTYILYILDVHVFIQLMIHGLFPIVSWNVLSVTPHPTLEKDVSANAIKPMKCATRRPKVWAHRWAGNKKRSVAKFDGIPRLECYPSISSVGTMGCQ